MQILIREGTASDKDFVYATWLKGLYYGNFYYGHMEKADFFLMYGKVLDALLGSNGPAIARIKVVCLEADPEVVLAYIAYSGPNLHYAFTKQSFRRQGLLNKLIESIEPITNVSHLTKLGNDIRLHKGYKFNPFLL